MPWLTQVSHDGSAPHPVAYVPTDGLRFRLPPGLKDLGDCLQKLPPDDPFWPRLFVF